MLEDMLVASCATYNLPDGNCIDEFGACFCDRALRWP